MTWADETVPITPHEARHVAISFMKGARVDDGTRQRVAGHGSARVTERYTHQVIEATALAGRQIDTFLEESLSG
jgi:integrase